MKALTICQPYAELIARGEKLCENRTWWAGPLELLVIHAGKSRRYLNVNDERDYPGMAFGAAVAVAELIGCVTPQAIERKRYSRYLYLYGHPYVEGPVCWALTNVRALTPIPCRGHQGLWTVPPDIEREIREQLG